MDRHIVLEKEEMYGEPFVIPEPDETVYIGWYSGGNVFRSGVIFNRSAGKIFYFQPGHETYPTYHNKSIQKIITNGVHYVKNFNKWSDVHDCPNAAPIIPIPGYQHKSEQGLR